MNIRTPRTVLLPLALWAAASAAPAQAVMKPGAWQMDTQITVRDGDGPPVYQGHHTVTMCMTAERLAQEPYLNAQVDQDKAAARGATCSTSDFQRQGDSASWVMVCDLKDGSHLRARISNRASAETLETEMVQDMRRGDGRATATLRVHGRHAGECTPAMAKL